MKHTCVFKSFSSCCLHRCVDSCADDCITGSKLELTSDFGWLQPYRDSIQKRVSLPVMNSVAAGAEPQQRGRSYRTVSANNDCVATAPLIDISSSESAQATSGEELCRMVIGNKSTVAITWCRRFFAFNQWICCLRWQLVTVF